MIHSLTAEPDNCTSLTSVWNLIVLRLKEYHLPCANPTEHLQKLFGLYHKGEDFCNTVQDCRRSSKWRVISRSILGECSLTFQTSINSGQSSAHIGQLQTPLQKEDHSYCRPRVLVRFQCWGRSMQMCLQPSGHCRNMQLPVKQAVKGYFRYFYIIFHCVIHTFSGLFFLNMSLGHCLMNGNGKSVSI